MPTVFDLANAFLYLESMTNKKLQKLCFYAKALYLAIYDENLIEEDFQAWVHGAVNPDLYFNYRRYGFDKIPMYDSDISTIPEEVMSFAAEVYEAYGHLTGDELEALNHTEDPWLNARKGLRPWQRCTEIINEEDIKDYYRRQLN